VLVVERIAQKQQSPLLSREKKHQPHHERQRGLIQFTLRNAGEDLPMSILINPVERADDLLDRLPNLMPQSIGNFLLVRGTILEHRLERLALAHAKKPANPQ
jgi:hypothetical protein